MLQILHFEEDRKNITNELEPNFSAAKMFFRETMSRSYLIIKY